jgi:23S rRNA (adenine2503-C2)-methyltransferase
MAPRPPIEIQGLTQDALVRAAREQLAAGAGRAREIYAQVMQEARFAPDVLQLNQASVTAWRETFKAEFLEPRHIVEEPGPLGFTAKAAFRLADGLEVETVHLPMGRGRSTLCVSTQVGCKMGCRFCETARMGLIRHLSAAEIVGQILVARHRLGWRFRNIVFMGMGEALDNFDALVQALRVLNDSAGLAIGFERMTVCTVGHIQGIRRLASLGIKRLNLSISLNSTSDDQRAWLMPVHRTTSLAELQQTLMDYRPRANFALGVNYCLLPGINDTREDAKRVADFCRPLGRVLVNVIPYNPGNLPIAPAPSDTLVDTFVDWLREENVPVRRRIVKGRSVMAACGQLGNAELRTQIRAARTQGLRRRE